MAACSYCGELISLLAIHLILLSVNKVNPNLLGSVHIYSDCLGALDKVENLPPHRIPSKCRHSDVLKNIDEVKRHGSGPARMHLQILDGPQMAPNGGDLHRERL